MENFPLIMEKFPLIMGARVSPAGWNSMITGEKVHDHEGFGQRGDQMARWQLWSQSKAA